MYTDFAEFEARLAWLEKAANQRKFYVGKLPMPKDEMNENGYIHKRIQSTFSDIHLLETFINLKPNYRIQKFWMPILSDFKKRLQEISKEFAPNE